MSRTVSIKVSIVEDDAKAREILVDWINRAEGFRCASHHGSGEDALAAMPEHKPQVVLMDINLPGMNGPECVRRLKPLLPQTQFVMLTVYEDADHIVQALQSGASGYLLKQTPRAVLINAIREVHAGGGHVDPKARAANVSVHRAAEKRRKASPAMLRMHSTRPTTSWRAETICSPKGTGRL